VITAFQWLKSVLSARGRLILKIFRGESVLASQVEEMIII
jgi:hypothetical protein